MRRQLPSAGDLLVLEEPQVVKIQARIRGLQVRRQLTPRELVGGGKASSPAAYLQAAEAAEAAEAAAAAAAEAASDPKGTKAKAAEAIQARVRGRQPQPYP
eukprot:scaffold119157_cov24-Phaeocystis_antarctica.AAC.1